MTDILVLTTHDVALGSRLAERARHREVIRLLDADWMIGSVEFRNNVEVHEGGVAEYRGTVHVIRMQRLRRIGEA